MGKEYQVFLPDEIASEIDAAIARGHFDSGADLIREAVEEWRARQLEDAIPVERLRVLVQEGVDSGPGEDGASFFKRLRDKFADAT